MPYDSYDKVRNIGKLIEATCAIVKSNMIEIEDFLVKELNLSKPIGYGSSRTVYKLNDNYVIKIPNSRHGTANGVESNLSEYLISTKRPELPCAKCQIYFHKNLPVLVMEKINEDRKLARPNALRIFCDGQGQLGKTKAGKTVCFDYGYEYYSMVDAKKQRLDFTDEELELFLKGMPDISTCPDMDIIFPKFAALTIQ